MKKIERADQYVIPKNVGRRCWMDVELVYNTKASRFLIATYPQMKA